MIRFAIFAAVSTKAQAAQDKISLPDQIRLCQQDGLTRNWKQTAGPFIVPGHTRTRYINLRDAENLIVNPDGTRPIKDLLDSAQRKEYDILILYHYNRLRELLEPIAKTLSAYRIQIVSHTQWTEPQPPETYDPLSDIGTTLRFATGFASAAEITELRRRYKIGMPARTLKGLHKGAIPYGYRKPPGHEYDRKAHLIPHPVTSPILIHIKDLFLQGQSLWQIAQTLNDQNIPSPRGGTWTDVKVRALLKNTFYSGTVAFGKTRLTTDPRTGLSRSLPNTSNIITAKGLHTPLWDQATQTRIDDEFKKRGRSYAGRRTHTLSHLLYCGQCGSRCWVNYSGGRAVDKNRIWSCSQDPAHVTRKDTELLPAFAAQLQTTLTSIPAVIPPPPVPNDPTHTIAEIQTRLTRIQDAYETGAMELPQYTARREQLLTSLKEHQTQQQQQTTAHQLHQQRRQTLTGIANILHQIPAYITQAPPQQVNTQLRTIIQKIIITPTTLSIELIE